MYTDQDYDSDESTGDEDATSGGYPQAVPGGEDQGDGTLVVVVGGGAMIVDDGR